MRINKRIAALCSLFALLCLLPSRVLAGTVSNVYETYVTSDTAGFEYEVDVAPDIGVILEVSTDSAFVGTVVSSMTTDLSAWGELYAIGLIPNTTYYARVGAIDVGTTNYVNALTGSFITAGLEIIGPQLLQVSSHSITVGWPRLPPGPGTASGYRLLVTTTNVCCGVAITTLTYNLALSTLTVGGLQYSTTYYAYVDSLNATMPFPLFTRTELPGSTTTLQGSTAAPTGFTGTATTPSSIQWSWNLVPGATGYSVLFATSATRVATVASLTYTENSLVANSSYTRVVAAWVNAELGVLSSSVTRYTLANQPAVGPTAIANVGTSSFTINWSTTNNPPYTPYEVIQALDSGFTVGVTTPVLFSAMLTAGTTVLTGLAADTTYYFHVRARNGDGVMTTFGPTSSTTTLSGPVATGQGSVSIAPTSISEGGNIQKTTFTFVVPNGGYTAGGGIKVQLPSNWYSNLQTSNSGIGGYVTALSNPSRTLVITSSSTGYFAEVVLGSGQSLAAGSTIQMVISGLWPTCPPPGLTGVFWSVSSRSAGAGSYGTLGSQPFQSYAAGTAEIIGYKESTPFMVVSGQASQAIVLQGQSHCGRPAPMPSFVEVELDGFLSYSYALDPNVEFSTSANFNVLVSTIGLAQGATETTFYYRTTSLGNGLSVQASFISPPSGTPTWINRYVTVLASGISFNSASIDSGTAGSGSSAYTLSPNFDGINDFAFIRFTPSDSTVQWRVRISSSNFTNWVYESWGSSSPTGSLQWDGRNYFAGNGVVNTVPNGTYVVRLEVPGLPPNDTMTIAISAVSISGRVRLGTTGIANAWVNANATTGSGHGGAMTDANGDYIINGLTTGQLYNLNTFFYSTNTQTQMFGSTTSIPAPSTIADITVQEPAILRVAATLNQAATFSMFGNINAHTSNYSNSYYGSIRVQTGLTTSDNGDSFTPSTWTLIVVQPGNYTVQLNMPSFPPTTQSATAVAGQTTDVAVFNLTRPANVFGLITLPNPISYSTWIPVDGIKVGSTNPSVWGGAYFSGGTTAIFSVYNVPPGSYNFRMRVPGYVPVLVSTTVGTSDIGTSGSGGLDVPSSSFTTGGTISGTLSVVGDTSGIGNNGFIYPWVNAYSPLLGSGEFTQVTLATHPVSTNTGYQISGLADGTYQVNPPYLYGFELNPPGPKTVVVTGGVGTLNLTLEANTGSVGGTITLPGANSDWSEVAISLNGPSISTTIIATSNSYSFTKLGSGFYNINASYATTGAQVRQSVSVVNGMPQSDLDLDLSADTFVITGSVTVQGAFTIGSSSSTPTTISTISDYLYYGTTQSFYLNGVPFPLVPTARVEAFPKRFDQFGNSNRSGFGNMFFGADFKYGAVQPDGSYSIDGLTPGVWEISVYPYLDGSYSPSFAVTKQVVTITNAPQADIDFPLSAGYSVAGTISLPGGATDNRNFDVRVLTDRGDDVQTAFRTIGSAGTPASSVAYEFKNLAPGRYSIMVLDPGTYDPIQNQSLRKYASKPVSFEITSFSIPALNITMGRAGRILGKISIRGKNADGSTSSTLVTENNTTLLPDNLTVTAIANPWVEGGYQQAAREFGMGMGRIDIDANNQFHIDGLVTGTYDVEFLQSTYGASFAGQGSLNLASYTQGQVIVPEGQAIDIGTVDLKQGLSISGTVQDTSSNLLANIRVRAYASGDKNHMQSHETFTDSLGQFTITGLSPDKKVYDIVAAPRPGLDDPTPASAFGQVVKKAVDVTAAVLPTLNFTLQAANASLSGQVNTADSGALGFPEGDQQGYPAAAIYLKQMNVVQAENDPLGDIREATSLSGSISITNLVPGSYEMMVVSLNYKPQKFTLTLAAGANSQPTITLARGASIDATLTKPDGSSVNTSEVRFAVGVTANLENIIFGQISSDDNTRTVNSIHFSGFDYTKTYNILLFDERDNIISPTEGRAVTFTSDTEEKTLSLTYQASAPTAYSQVRKVGNDAEITFHFSRTLRNATPSDSDVTTLMSVFTGNGTFSSFTISGDRRSLSVLYTPPTGEASAVVRFNGSTADINPSTGSEFTISKTVQLYFGQSAIAEKNISPVFGGEITLAETLSDPSGVNLPANALLSDDGSTADADTSYGIRFTATEDVADVLAGAPGRSVRAARLASQMARGENAYIPEAFAAMKAAHASVTVNPLSSFYSVLLPQGLSHTLSQTATITLQYDSSADPESINIYYFDGSKYLIENSNRVIDTVNRTITVGVSHFSTFVVLENSLPVVITDGDSGSAADLQVMNFPNPFDLTAKTKSLSHGGTTATMDTNGTIIRYLVPSGKEGIAKLDIFNVVGEKVRTISLGSPTADIYHYVSWDGKNDSGNNVASGVYVGMLKVGGNKKTWKMAVIK